MELRERVRGGDISYCRTLGLDSLAAVDLVQYLFDEALPYSATAQGSYITHRYPNFVACYEKGNGDLSLHGTHRTLVLRRAGWNRAEARQRHWQNFLDCIRTRRKPAGDIETCVRAATLRVRSRDANRFVL
jgi:hypothetical protein